jgi:hypothetical protein
MAGSGSSSIILLRLVLPPKIPFGSLDRALPDEELPEEGWMIVEGGEGFEASVPIIAEFVALLDAVPPPPDPPADGADPFCADTHRAHAKIENTHSVDRFWRRINHTAEWAAARIGLVTFSVHILLPIVSPRKVLAIEIILYPECHYLVIRILPP